MTKPDPRSTQKIRREPSGDRKPAAVASAVEEQGSATAEIADNCQRAAGAATGVTGTIGTVGQAAEATGRSAGELMTLATDLSANAGTLQSEVQSFVEALKAADVIAAYATWFTLRAWRGSEGWVLLAGERTTGTR